MDIQHHPPKDDSGLRVYSTNDEISDEELDLCLSKVKSRETPIYLPFATRIYDEERDKLYERFCELRMNDYLKIVKPEDIYVPEGSKYPPEIHMWDDDQYCIFDWTFNNEFYDLAELGDYQRICPTRKAENEYYNWEEYQLTLSSYETDEDYVKYCDELSKRIKWVEEHRHLDNREFSKIKHRGFKQAMKIASEFSHLPYSLAVRGYEEHIWYMRPEMILKDLDKLCFEIWKRVIKQKMDFRQALEDILATNMFPSLSPLIKAEIEGSFCILSMQFEICKEHIPENVELDDLLGKINYVVFESLKPKTYVSYVTKKLEIGRRLQLPSRFPKAVNEQYMDP